MLIAEDIGNTRMELAILSIEGGPHLPFAQVKMHGADYPGLQAMDREFNANHIPIQFAHFRYVEHCFVPMRGRDAEVSFARAVKSLSSQGKWKSIPRGTGARE